MLRTALYAIIVMMLFCSAVLAGPGATVREVSGRADWRRGNAGGWQQVSRGLQLLDGDQLFTGPAGTVTLVTPAGQVTLRPLTRAFLAHTQQGNGLVTTNMSLELGELLARTAHTTGNTTNLTVSTPVGSLGIRGSASAVSYTPDFGLQVRHIDGEAGFSSMPGRSGELAPGQNATVEPDGSVTPALDAARAQAMPPLLPAGSDPVERELENIAGTEPQMNSEPVAPEGAPAGISEAPGDWSYYPNSGWYYYPY